MPESSALAEKLAEKGDSRIYVLDNGYVELRGTFHDEDSILDITRITTNQAGYKKTFNERLLRRMIEEGHMSPMDFAQVWIEVKAPFFVKHQWFRHRTAARFEAGPAIDTDDPQTSQFHAMQEFSARYAALPSGYYLPPLEWMKKQSTDNHQGAADEVIENADWVRSCMETQQLQADDEYRRAMAHGLARQTARINLPLATYTTWQWQQSLPMMLHWLELRRAHGAQPEIVEYAKAVEKLVSEKYPRIFKAWDDLVSGARLSRSEVEALREVMTKPSKGLEPRKNLGPKLVAKLGLPEVWAR